MPQQGWESGCHCKEAGNCYNLMGKVIFKNIIFKNSLSEYYYFSAEHLQFFGDVRVVLIDLNSFVRSTSI